MLRHGLKCLVLVLVLGAPTVRAQQWFSAHVGRLASSPPVPSQSLGRSIGLSGERAIVNVQPSGARVFVRSAGEWVLEDQLGAGPGSSAWFGYSVAIEGDVAVVCDLQRLPSSGNPLGPGIAYVYRRGSTWELEDVLSPSDGALGDSFGEAVALSGDRVLIGAGQNNAAYVFVHANGEWTEEAKLSCDGDVVALHGDLAVVPVGSFARAYRRVGATWILEDTLTANPSQGSAFGQSAAAGENLIAVGTGKEVFIFERSGGAWGAPAVVSAPPDSINSGFGSPIALEPNGDALVIGARLDDTAGATWAGAAYVAGPTATGWEMKLKLTDPDFESSAHLGEAVAIQGACVLAAAPGDDLNSINGAGSVSEFRLNPAWEQTTGAVAGSAGVPEINGFGNLEGDSLITLELDGAKPFAVAPLVASLVKLNAPFKGGTMVPDVDFVFPLFTDFTGAADIAAIWPVGAPPGLPVYFQWWVKDPGAVLGYAATTGLVATTP